MNTKIFVAVLISFCLASFSYKKKRIVFFGDSITELGVKPDGYVTKLGQMLDQKNLSKDYEVAGAGIGGNKVYDLYLRMEEDVMKKEPDAVVVWIGVNDVWHKKLAGTGTDPDKFEKFYNAIIKKLQDKDIKVYLVTPAVIGEKTDYTNELDGDLNRYSVIIKIIAKNNNCQLLDLRNEFHQYLLNHNPENKEKGILTNDGVHLNEAGNQFVAEKMYELLKGSFIKP